MEFFKIVLVAFLYFLVDFFWAKATRLDFYAEVKTRVPIIPVLVQLVFYYFVIYGVVFRNSGFFMSIFYTFLSLFLYGFVVRM